MSAPAPSIRVILAEDQTMVLGALLAAMSWRLQSLAELAKINLA